MAFGEKLFDEIVKFTNKTEYMNAVCDGFDDLDRACCSKCGRLRMSHLLQELYTRYQELQALVGDTAWDQQAIDELVAHNASLLAENAQLIAERNEAWIELQRGQREMYWEIAKDQFWRYDQWGRDINSGELSQPQ